MRKGLALWSAMLFLAATAAAQDAPGSSFSLLAPASAPAARSSRPGPFERYSWQLGFGYSFRSRAHVWQHGRGRLEIPVLRCRSENRGPERRAHRAVGACHPGRGQILSARGERYGQRRVRSGRRRGLANHAAILFSHARRLAGNAFVQHYPEQPQNRRGVRVQLLAAASASYAAGGRARVSEGNIHHA